MFNRLKSMAGVLSVIILLVIPSAVFAADDPPPVFYVYMDTDRTDENGAPISDLVEINTGANTVTKILSIDPSASIETTLEAFSSLEWLVFQEALIDLPSEKQAQVLADMSTPGLNARTHDIWQDHAGNFLIARYVSKCFIPNEEEMPPEPLCYGAIQLSLLERETQQERMLWSLPYHAQQGDDPNGCYTATWYENYSGHMPVDQVLLHPTRDVMVVRRWSFGGCAHRAFVIDYSAADLVVQEIADVISLAWSPDFESLAYVDQTDCQTEMYVCTYTYGTLELTTLEKAPFKEMSLSGNADAWIVWPTPEMFVLSASAIGMGGDDTIQGLLWRSSITGEESMLNLPANQHVFKAFTLHDGDVALVLGSGDLVVVTYSSIAFDETPGVLISDNAPVPSESHSANHAYAIGTVLEQNTVGFIDAEFNFYPIDLAPYEERYGGTLARLAIVGVEQP